MALYRNVHTTFWTDPFVESLDKDQKLFYLYILTNTKTHLCGIYEISKKLMSYETGFAISEIDSLIKFFSDKDKMYYSESTNEIAIKNWAKYNVNDSGKQVVAVHNALSKIKDLACIEYTYPMHTLSIEHRNPIHTASPGSGTAEASESKEESIPVSVTISVDKKKDTRFINQLTPEQIDNLDF